MTAPIQSAEEAHEVHEDSNKPLLRAARAIAYELAQRHGYVNSNMVTREMRHRGLPTRREGKDRSWTGSIFKRKDAGWAKHRPPIYTYDREDNVHVKLTYVWTLEDTPPPSFLAQYDGSTRCAQCARSVQKEPPTQYQHSTCPLCGYGEHGFPALDL